MGYNIDILQCLKKSTFFLNIRVMTKMYIVCICINTFNYCNRFYSRRSEASKQLAFINYRLVNVSCFCKQIVFLYTVLPSKLLCQILQWISLMYPQFYCRNLKLQHFTHLWHFELMSITQKHTFGEYIFVLVMLKRM